MEIDFFIILENYPMIVILINNPLRKNNNELLIELLRFLFIIVSTVNKIDVMKNFNADDEYE